MRRALPILVLLAIAGRSLGADFSREARIREQIEDSILIGEAITLRADGHGFLAIHTEADTPKTIGAAIILHGMGADPNRTTVIRPLRADLAEHGWTTLSLQMPVAASDAPASAWRRLITEAGPRIAAAVTQLKDSGILNIVLIGHSLGADMGLSYLAGQQPEAIRAFVAIGLSAGGDNPDDSVLRAIAKLKIPVLDIFGGEDLPAVRQTARARRIAARKAGNARYRQIRIDGADHFFSDMDDVLDSRIRAWLHKTAKGVEIKK